MVLICCILLIWMQLLELVQFDLIQKITRELKIPVEVAGGLRNETIIERAMSFATRVVIGTLAFQRQRIITKNCKKIQFFKKL